MTRRMRRRGVVPFAFAALLTLAAGLSLAEEHAWVPSLVPQASVTSPDLSSGSAEGAGSTGGHVHKAATRKPGVGSRALTGHDARAPGADERPATGLDDRSQSLD